VKHLIFAVAMCLAPFVASAGPADAPMTIVLDPGHGGADPGAEVAGIAEKTLMLNFARDLQAELSAGGGVTVALTRTGDEFVPLGRRVALAHEMKADAFISLHADALVEGRAHGATVYILSHDASDAMTAQLVAQQKRGVLLNDVDLEGTDDTVARVLLDLARQETEPRAQALADALIEAMVQGGGPVNRRPKRAGSFAVLKAADIPSVLIEVGFLSSPRDLRNLEDPRWRAQMVTSIARGIRNWKSSDDMRRLMMRQ
jgi:N-acetylmuramoyl-L-alanine amidase